MTDFAQLLDRLGTLDPVLIGIGVIALLLLILLFRRPKDRTGPLQDALAAGTRVSDRQKQGFAIVRHDFEQCVEQVCLLNELLSRCAFAAGGGSAASSGPPPGAHASATVAPAST